MTTGFLGLSLAQIRDLDCISFPGGAYPEVIANIAGYNFEVPGRQPPENWAG